MRFDLFAVSRLSLQIRRPSFFHFSVLYTLYNVNDKQRLADTAVYSMSFTLP